MHLKFLIKVLKTFLILEDISDKDGPFQVVQGSHKIGYKSPLKKIMRYLSKIFGWARRWNTCSVARVSESQFIFVISSKTTEARPTPRETIERGIIRSKLYKYNVERWENIQTNLVMT